MGIIFHFQLSILLNGVYSDGDPPLPIPNREVKPVSADGTAERWESRSMPDLEKSDSNESLFFYDVNGIPFSIFSIFNCKFYILNLFFYLSALNQFM